MIVSHKHKFIFIHIHKCAGTSVSHALVDHLGPNDILLGCTKEGEALSDSNRKEGKIWKHSTAKEAKEYLGNDIWDSYFKFTFIRSPWARCVSIYHWWLTTNWEDEYGTKEKIKAMSFYEYTQSYHIKNMSPCYGFIYDKYCLLDFIGKQESITKDFSYICGRIGIPNVNLPHNNKTQHSDFQEYYVKESSNIVRGLFLQDVKTFNYRFPWEQLKWDVNVAGTG